MWPHSVPLLSQVLDIASLALGKAYWLSSSVPREQASYKHHLPLTALRVNRMSRPKHIPGTERWIQKAYWQLSSQVKTVTISVKAFNLGMLR